jgi:Solute-binding protein AdeT 1/2
MKAKQNLNTIMALLLFFSCSAVSAKLPKRTLCVFDVAGAHGEIFNRMKDYQIAALAWGVELNLKAYTDEKVAAEDFKAHQCDAVTVTGLRARAFNKFTGTISAFGAIPSYDHMRLVMQAVTHPKMAQRMLNGDFEIAGVLPLGAAYLFVNDRNIDTPEELSGKKIATMDYDRSQASLASALGATPVSVDITTFAGKFNNGSVDICGAPAEAYGVLELYKGLEPHGGIVSLPLLQVSLQTVIRKNRFPEQYGQHSRQFFYDFLDDRMQQIDTVTARIDSKWWMKIEPERMFEYLERMRKGRIELTQEGVYDPAMLKLLKKVRCKLEATHPECSDSLEG